MGSVRYLLHFGAYLVVLYGTGLIFDKLRKLYWV